MRLDLDVAVRPRPQTSHVQVAAISVRWKRGAAEILLITTRGKSRWTIPKGWPLTESPNAQCAAREAFEEAGVTGRVSPYAVGEFQYMKKLKDASIECSASAYLLDVETVHDGLARAKNADAHLGASWRCKTIGRQ